MFLGTRECGRTAARNHADHPDTGRIIHVRHQQFRDLAHKVADELLMLLHISNAHRRVPPQGFTRVVSEREQHLGAGPLGRDPVPQHIELSWKLSTQRPSHGQLQVHAPVRPGAFDHHHPVAAAAAIGGLGRWHECDPPHKVACNSRRRSKGPHRIPVRPDRHAEPPVRISLEKVARGPLEHAEGHSAVVTVPPGATINRIFEPNVGPCLAYLEERWYDGLEKRTERVFSSPSFIEISVPDTEFADERRHDIRRALVSLQ